MKSLGVVNQKGGVGKSTFATNLGHASEERGARTLLIDLDPQKSLTLSFPPTDGAAKGDTTSALFTNKTEKLRPEYVSERVAILRADDNLSRVIDDDVSTLARRPLAHLRRLSSDFDTCIIDTPGNISLGNPMLLSALLAADAIVCPFQVGLYESQSLADLWAYLKTIRSPKYNPRLRVLGLLPSKINTKSKEELKGVELLRESFGDLILPGQLAEMAAVKQATMRRQPVWRATKGGGHQKAAKEWRQMCDLILTKLMGEVRK